jgi:acetyl esterase/lipase
LIEHKPVFQILVYPSTDVETPPHDPWRARLGYPGPETNTFKLVNSNTPPTLIVMSTEDTTTTYESNGQPYVDACEAHGVPCEKILKPMGRHGFGLTKEWKAPCEEWMAKHGWCALDVPKTSTAGLIQGCSFSSWRDYSKEHCGCLLPRNIRQRVWTFRRRETE